MNCLFEKKKRIIFKFYISLRINCENLRKRECKLDRIYSEKSFEDKFVEFLSTLLTIIDRTIELRLAPLFERISGTSNKLVFLDFVFRFREILKCFKKTTFQFNLLISAFRFYDTHN
jgi:hypothetical protein